jgi:hypothetical protein
MKELWVFHRDGCVGPGMVSPGIGRERALPDLPSDDLFEQVKDPCSMVHPLPAYPDQCRRRYHEGEWDQVCGIGDHEVNILRGYDRR